MLLGANDYALYEDRMNRPATEMELRVAKRLQDVLARHSADAMDDDLALDLARMAIREMREPTRNMHMMGEEAIFQRHREERKWVDDIRARTGGLPAWESMGSIAAWQAMIDAASPPERTE